MKRQRSAESGNVVVEFALVAGFLIPLMLGSFFVGMSLSRAIQVNTLCRSAGSMFVRYVNFQLDNNKGLILRMAQGLSINPMTLTSGNGVVYLSQVMKIGPRECYQGGLGTYTASTNTFTATSACSNNGQVVLMKRNAIGNTSLRTSTLGQPASSDYDTSDNDGSLLVNAYLTQSNLVAPSFSGSLALADGEQSFVSEAYFVAPEFDLPGFFAPARLYARNYF